MILWRAGLIWLLLAGTAHALDLSLPGNCLAIRSLGNRW